MVPVLLAAAQGRLADAARQLEDVEGHLDANNGIAARNYLSATQLQMLTEQREFGPLFDDAAALHASTNIPPTIVSRPHRGNYFRIAMGRIAQYRAATDEPDRAARLAQARAALRNMGKCARDDISKSRLAIAQADLFVATGEPRRAVRLLHRDETIHRPPAPFIDFDRARVLARAYTALDAPSLARRQVHVALGIAEEEGWPHRAGWVTAEFRSSLRNAQSSTVTATQVRTTSRTGSTGIVAGSNDRQRLRALEQLGRAASRVLDPEELARIALDETIRILRADRAFLFLDGRARRAAACRTSGRDADGDDLGELTGYSASLVERVRDRPGAARGHRHRGGRGARRAERGPVRPALASWSRRCVLDDRLLGVVYLDSQVAKGIFTADDAGIAHRADQPHRHRRWRRPAPPSWRSRCRPRSRQRDLAEQLRAAFEAMSDTLDPEKILVRLMRRLARCWQSTGPGC